MLLINVQALQETWKKIETAWIYDTLSLNNLGYGFSWDRSKIAGVEKVTAGCILTVSENV